MKLTPENKAQIDGMSYHELLLEWQFAPDGDPWFQGETGQYWSERMAQLRPAGESGASASSKTIGCDQ